MESSKVKTEKFSFKCGDCCKFFKSKEDIHDHSHTMDIVEQMRENGESEEDILALIKYNNEMEL